MAACGVSADRQGRGRAGVAFTIFRPANAAMRRCTPNSRATAGDHPPVFRPPLALTPAFCRGAAWPSQAVSTRPTAPRRALPRGHEKTPDETIAGGFCLFCPWVKAYSLRLSGVSTSVSNSSPPTTSSSIGAASAAAASASSRRASMTTLSRCCAICRTFCVAPPRPRRDQSPDDDVFLEAHELVTFALYGCFGKNPRGFLE